MTICLISYPVTAFFNVKAEYNLSDFTFSGRVNNLLNKEYSDVGQLGYDPAAGFSPGEAYYPSPEINFFADSSMEFQII